MIFNGVVIGSLVTLLATLTAVTVAQNRHILSLKDINKLNTFTDLIEKLYYGDYTKEDIKSGIFEGVFTNLDKYSYYISKEDYAEQQNKVSEEFYGIGISYGYDVYNEVYKIISVFKDTPAYNAGLKHNDIITKVNEVAVEKENNIMETIRGEKGTTVNITVLRDDEELDFTIERTDIKTKYSEAYSLTDDTGYISVTSFSGDLATDFAESLAKVSDKKNLILDLRNNVGGNVEIMLDVLKQIVPDDLIVTLYYKSGETEEFHVENGTEVNHTFYILVNENTASSSEIMSAYMQEKGYATIIGSQTYGKGIVQGFSELEDGSAISLTFGSYKTPNGVDLGGIGVTPDILTKTDFDTFDTIDDVLNDKDVQTALQDYEKRMN
jgi:carboxyl-terminal processing protease